MTIQERRSRITEAAMQVIEDAQPVLLQLEPYVVVTLIAQLQLALRHPANTGVSADTSRKLIMDLIHAMPEGARELLMLGFDPEYDT